MWQGWKGGRVSFRGIWSRLLPFSCLADGLTLAVLTCFKDKDNSIENHGYNQVFLSLWHVLFLCAGNTSWARPYAQHHGGFMCSVWSTGNNEILNSEGQSPWKAAILGGGGECSWPLAPEAWEAFLYNVCIVCQHIHSMGGYPLLWKESWTLFPVIREMGPAVFLLHTWKNVFFFCLYTCRLPSGFKIIEF